MRAAIALVCLATTAHADSFEDHDTFGLDVASAWEPANGDAFGAGPMFRFETFTSRIPSWLGIVSRFGLITDSADRVYAPASLGLMVRHGRVYYGVDGGATFNSEVGMEDGIHVDWTLGAAFGVRLGNWDLHVSPMFGGMFGGDWGMPAAHGEQMGGFFYVMMAFNLVFVVAFCALFAWIIKRLASDGIRREFGAA